MSGYFSRWSQIVDKYLHVPGLSEKEFLRKQVSFYWTLSAFFAVLTLTILAYVLKAAIIGDFGIVLLVGYGCIFFLYSTRLNHDIYSFFFLVFVILTAFIFILICGGYLHSGGLVFVGIYCVFTSALFKEFRKTLFVILIYVMTILVIALVNPYLQVHQDMTPRINFTFFIINTIWMSSSQMFFIMYYFDERGKHEALEVDRLTELNAVKTKLYTNVTHEFRTPITLILGMADQLNTANPKTNRTVSIIKRNAGKLLWLVNQMMSLAKLESGKINKTNIQTDIVSFLYILIDSFLPEADSKKIKLLFKPSIPKLEMDFDPPKMEEVITNLVMNAIQNTEEGGQILVYLEVLSKPSASKDGIEKFIQLRVEDSGVGIPGEQLGKIFDRFYQVKDEPKYHREGSGIGLSLVQENIRLMEGSISVQSTTGSGSRFIVNIPLTHDAPRKSFALSNAYQEKANDKTQTSITRDYSNSASRSQLLIIEDHVEMISYLESILRNEYLILSAKNGLIGLQKAMEFVPDIIICDVMMPKMDGFEFLQKLKTNIRTSHIPVVMLTAKVDMMSKHEGLERGAEVYLTKPFNEKELRIRLKKLIEQREKLQQRYVSFNMSKFAKDTSNFIEDQFFEKVHEILEEHIDNSKFGVQELGRSLGLSRTQLYRKFSALTNIAVDKYIRKYRLHKAMNLLKTTDLNMSEIALEVGITSPAYFSRVFKKEFGISPREV